MLKCKISIVFFSVVISIMMTAGAFAVDQDAARDSLIDATFENNDLNMAVQILVHEKVPVADIIKSAQTMGFGNIKIVDALLDTALSCEDVILASLKNNVPSNVILNSTRICGPEYGYTPESVLQLLVEKKISTDIIVQTCQSMISQGSTKYDIILNIYQANADNQTIINIANQLNVPAAVVSDICPECYGFGKKSKSVPRSGAHVIGKDRISNGTTDTGRGPISPYKP